MFRIKASKVYPYTMGLAPVVDLYSNKIGFVDKSGKKAIPCIYTLRYNKAPAFNSDSMMILRLDGVEGKLHRNGKFYTRPK